MNDGLTVIDSKPLISPEKIKDKTLDQMSLPERADLLREAYHHIDNTEEDVTEDEMEVIGALTEKLEEKVVSWGLVVQKIDEASNFCKIEQDYFQAKANEAKSRSERFQKKIESMKKYIKAKMMEFNLKKIESPMVNVSLRKRPQSVEIMEGADLEDPEKPEFVLTTVSRRWDKKAIKDKLKGGQLFESVKLSEPDFSISIKGS